MSDKYRVTAPDGIRYLGTGRRWGEGQLIGETELPAPLLRQLVKEKAVRKIKPQKDGESD